jgi:hypothetical protein
VRPEERGLRPADAPIISVETGECLVVSGGRDGIAGLEVLRMRRMIAHARVYGVGVVPGFSGGHVGLVAGGRGLSGGYRQLSSYLFEQDATGAWLGGRLRLRWLEP